MYMFTCDTINVPMVAVEYHTCMAVQLSVCIVIHLSAYYQWLFALTCHTINGMVPLTTCTRIAKQL